ncbi:MAG: hypothetical protein SGJ23_01980 [Alphaproteobacteria bacterium]|nr:hypothetical protein [Alphaproteobacteria bacterium]
MKRIIALAALLGACSPAAPLAPDAAVAGCWQGLNDIGTVTLGWTPDAANVSQLNGQADTVTSPGGHGMERYSLARDGKGWRLCETSYELPECFSVVTSGEAKTHAVITGDGKSLRIAIPTDDGTKLVIDGKRADGGGWLRES